MYCNSWCKGDNIPTYYQSGGGKMIRLGTNNSEIRSNGHVVSASVFLPLLLAFCFSILVFTGCSRQNEDKTPPSTAIVIRINNKEITRGEFQDIFKRTFLEGGVDGEIKEEELRDLKRALLNQLVEEDEARKYYKEHIDDYKVKEQIRARMIVVKTEEEANQIRERLKKGEDFAKLAEEVSLSPEGKKGGDLGFFGRG